MERLAMPNATILVHTLSGCVVEYNGCKYTLDKVQGGSTQWYNNEDYYIHFNDEGIVYECLKA